jgi:hypothetical protein
MRRFSLLLFVLMLALVLPSAALARTHSARLARAAAPHHARVLLPSPALAASARATCTISGTALAFSGTPIASAEVDWGYDNAGSWVSGGFTTTDAAGHFTLTNVLVTAAGTLDVYPVDSNDYFGRTALNFIEGASFVIQPGHVAFTTDHAAPGTAWTSVYVYTYGTGGSSAATLSAASGEIPATATSVDHAVAYWFINEGKELTLPAPIAVTPGVLSAGGINITEAGAQFVTVSSPAWASGAPGTKVTLEVDNWTAPMTAAFSFRAENPNDTRGTYPWAAPFIGTASASRTVTVTIPKQIKPGFGVRVYMAGSDASTSLLDLYDRFQVCTLVASKASIAKGASVRLNGVIPANGAAKKIILYSRTTKASAQPSKWDAAKAGWKKVATISAGKTGAFKSGLLKPTRTTWYVVRYPGDSKNFEAFTAVLKVAVH